MDPNVTSNNFIHFGCWNKGGCSGDTLSEKDRNNLTKLMNTLDISIKKEQPLFLSICGDNYYPQKVKLKTGDKKKILNIEDLVSGFDCLPKHIDIYMTYGNHDLETDLYINDIQEHICTLTSTEIEIVSNSNIHLNLNQTADFGDNTKVLFLETTIWDPDENEQYEQCYRYIDDDKYKNIIEVKEDQLSFIREFVSDVNSNDKIKNIIIVGHHPLALFKEKKGEMRFFILNEEFNTLLYDEIYTKCNPNIMYYYLCADLHQYQPGTIIINGTMLIDQYIVGTGGAELDNIIIDQTIESARQGNIQYNIKKDETIVDYGFLNCRKDKDGNLSFSFIRVNQSGGRKRRTRKRRTRKGIKKNKSKIRKSRFKSPVY